MILEDELLSEASESEDRTTISFAGTTSLTRKTETVSFATIFNGLNPMWLISKNPDSASIINWPFSSVLIPFCPDITFTPFIGLLSKLSLIVPKVRFEAKINELVEARVESASSDEYKELIRDTQKEWREYVGAEASERYWGGGTGAVNRSNYTTIERQIERIKHLHPGFLK